MCTSREALGLRREQIVPIGSLPADEGFALFAERATAVRPDLDVEVAADVIRRICARLDGIPLAIEVAAARCRATTPTEINDFQLSDRFGITVDMHSRPLHERVERAELAETVEADIDVLERIIAEQTP